MALLHDGELSELPDILGLKSRKPLNRQTSQKKTQLSLTTEAGSVENVDSRRAANSNAIYVSSRLQNSEPRRQRPLKKISNNVVSLPQPFVTPKRAKDDIPSLRELKKDLDTVRKTPGRKAKANVKAIVLEVEDEETGDDESGSSFEELSAASEGEEDSIIEIISWRKPIGGQLRSPFREKPKSECDNGHRSRSKTEGSTLPPGSILFVPSLSLPQNTSTRKESSRPSSSEADKAAILTYEPPRRRSPIKAPPTSRPRTPSPPPSPSKSKLVSPSKIQTYIPPTPHRPSIDAFWAPDVINAWNDQYSPHKTLTSPRKNRFVTPDSDEEDFSPSVSPRKGPSKSSPTRKDKAAAEAKKSFEARKHNIVENFLKELDVKITGGQLGALSASTGGVKIVWSKKLNTTAGRAHWRRETIKIVGTNGEETREYKHHCSIELATKVISSEERLLNVLAHEFCHLATFMISGEKKNPHGKEFRSWGAKVGRAFGNRGVEVTTKHGYEIEYKYVWECVECGHEFKRHSKSVDVAKSRCGVCKGRLVQTKPAVRGGKVTEYQSFVKDMFAKVKAENPGAGHGIVMEILGKLYRERKAAASPEKKDEKGIDDLTRELEITTLDD